MKITVTESQNYDKTKDGRPILDTHGKQKFRSVVKTVEKGNDFITIFGYKPLNKGDVLEGELKTEMYNGKQQYSFVPVVPNRAQSTQQATETLAELKTQTAILRQMLDRLDSIGMNLSTHRTIEEISSKKIELTPVSEMDFDPDRTDKDYGEPSAIEVTDEFDYGVH